MVMEYLVPYRAMTLSAHSIHFKRYEAETAGCEDRFPLRCTRRRGVTRAAGEFDYGSGSVCWLKRSPCGLKQAPWSWK